MHFMSILSKPTESRANSEYEVLNMARSYELGVTPTLSGGPCFLLRIDTDRQQPSPFLTYANL